MFIEFNPNPLKRRVGDCAVRAVAKALDIDWESAFAELAASAYQMGDMPSANSVLAAVLRKHGFYREMIPNTCPDCYTASDFCRDHPYGTYVLCFSGHVCTCQDGAVYDSWNSENEIPLFYWYRKER